MTAGNLHDCSIRDINSDTKKHTRSINSPTEEASLQNKTTKSLGSPKKISVSIGDTNLAIDLKAVPKLNKQKNKKINNTKANISLAARLGDD